MTPLTHGLLARSALFTGETGRGDAEEDGVASAIFTAHPSSPRRETG